MNVPVGSRNGPKASGDEQPSTSLEPGDRARHVGHGDTDMVDPEQPGTLVTAGSVPFRFGDQSGLLGSRSYAIPFG